MSDKKNPKKKSKTFAVPPSATSKNIQNRFKQESFLYRLPFINKKEKFELTGSNEIKACYYLLQTIKNNNHELSYEARKTIDKWILTLKSKDKNVVKWYDNFGKSTPVTHEHDKSIILKLRHKDKVLLKVLSQTILKNINNQEMQKQWFQKYGKDVHNTFSTIYEKWISKIDK